MYNIFSPTPLTITYALLPYIYALNAYFLLKLSRLQINSFEYNQAVQLTHFNSLYDRDIEYFIRSCLLMLLYIHDVSALTGIYNAVIFCSHKRRCRKLS